MTETATATSLSGRRSAGGSYAIGTWLFLRLLGVVYLIAFWSLGSQIRGLAGAAGILPAEELMTAASRWASASGQGVTRFLAVPTICWLGAGDTMLVSLCAVGAVLSLLQIAGVASALVLPFLWLFYLSLATVCEEFLAFQWDALLLEAGLIAVALAPWTLFHRPRQSEPHPVARWLIWWLLFRLMCMSGVVKLASGDPMWQGLTALTVHYETQPLPTPLGWYAHHLPIWFQRASTAIVLLVELFVPWTVFTPRRLRHLGAAVLLALQVVIAMTGNYAFFNLLTIALTLALFDDGVWRRWTGKTQGLTFRRRTAESVLPFAVAAVTLTMSIAVLASQTGVGVPGSRWLAAMRGRLAPFRSVNAYGLFAVMTASRPELIVEGSNDGQQWTAYEFKYKPGDVRRGPSWVAPHQPRLDWQMWFAALDRFDRSPWLERFCHRLLEGVPAVLDLLAVNPFPAAPPRFIRVMRAEYRIAPLARHRREGVWWTHDEPQPYSPVMSLE